MALGLSQSDEKKICSHFCFVFAAFHLSYRIISLLKQKLQIN
jgi:hypothetical protein